MKTSLSLKKTGLCVLLLICVIGFESCKVGIDDPQPDPISDPTDPVVSSEGVYTGRLTNNFDLWLHNAYGFDAAYGNGKWVIVGEDIFISQDAIRWKRVATGLAHLRRVIWAEDRFVALGEKQVYTSLDGELWSLVYSSPSIFSDPDEFLWTGQYCLAIDNGKMLRCNKQGDTWEELSSGDDIVKVENDGLQLLAVGGYGNQFFSSTDHGESWTEKSMLTENIKGFIWDGNQFWAYSGDILFTSSDGINWNQQGEAIDPPGRIRTIGGKLFGIESVDFGPIGQYTMYESSDGLNWERSYDGIAERIEQVASSSVGLLAVGKSNILHNQNGEEWLERSPRFSSFLGRIKRAFGKTTILDSQWSGMVVTEDGESFDFLGAEFYGDAYTAATWTGSRYVFVGENGAIKLTSNGLDKQIPLSPTTEDILDVQASPMGIVAVGQKGVILFSENGDTWEDYSIPEEGNFQRVEFQNGIFFALGGSKMYLSLDGKNWESLASDINLWDIVYNGEKFVGHDASSTFTSEDGKNWQQFLAGTNPDLVYEGEFKGIEWTGEEFISVICENSSSSGIYASKEGSAWTLVKSLPTGAAAWISDISWGGDYLLISGFIESPIMVAEIN